MTRTPMTESSATPASRFLPLLVVFFLGSGCAALIYEVVWFQMLSLIVGSSAISIGVLLGTFMGGMCLGSILLPRFVSAQHHPLKVYAALEAAIAVCGLLVLAALPFIGNLYIALAGEGFTGLLVRGLIAGLCLLPPTLLMGATLPAMARWVQMTPQGVSWLGFFYGGNIVGAVAGCLFAGFYLLRLHDVAIATYAAVALNLIVAAAALVTAKFAPYAAAKETSAHPSPAASTSPGAWPVYVAIGLSGMCALGAEVVWTRLLSLLLGQTVYTFSLILAGFLFGLAIGSSVGSSIGRSVRNPRIALGVCQFLLIGAIGWAAYALTQGVPYWPVYPMIATQPGFQLQLDIARCLWVVLPAAILWGASFPLALASLARGQNDPGRLVGRVYAANTVGAILGAFIASIVLIPGVGTQHSQQILISLAGVAALLMLGFAWDERGRVAVRLPQLSWAVAVVVLGVWMASTVIPVPALLVGFGRNTAARAADHGEFIFVGEGMNSSMAVSELGGGVRNYHNAGKVQASSEPQDMRLQRMLGHLTTLLPAKTDSVLVIGCGAGVTAGAVSIEPALKKLTIAEIEPLVPKVVAKYFGAHNFNVVDNPKTHVQIDDARHFLLSTDQKFDAITSDPFDPWVKGAASLYTKEFFEVAKSRLNPGGVVTVFVQLYESTEAAVKSEVATFFEVFPNGAVFTNTYMGEGYDVVLVGQVEPLQINVDQIEARLQSPEYQQVKASLAEIGFQSAAALLGTYVGQPSDMKAWLADAQINRDRNLRLQYLAGMGANFYIQGNIHRRMVAGKQYPEGMFVGNPDTLRAMRWAITGSP